MSRNNVLQMIFGSIILAVVILYFNPPSQTLKNVTHVEFHRGSKHLVIHTLDNPEFHMVGLDVPLEVHIEPVDVSYVRFDYIRKNGDMKRNAVELYIPDDSKITYLDD